MLAYALQDVEGELVVGIRNVAGCTYTRLGSLATLCIAGYRKVLGVGHATTRTHAILPNASTWLGT